MYAAQVLAWTTLPLAPQKAHELGVEDLATIQEERQEIAEGLGFPEGGKAIEAYNTSDTGFARSREEIVGRAEEQVQRGWGAAPRFFGRRPRGDCQVRPAQEFREAD